MLKTAIKAAKQAGKIALNRSGKIKKISRKSDKSYVTDADHLCEKTIISIIRKKYPDHNIVAEESGDHNNGSEYTWYIDPIDGTSNYILGLPIFGISIGIKHKNKNILGVVYLPKTNELFTAEKGKGSYLNNKRIKVSKKGLKDSVLIVDSGIAKENLFKRLRNSVWHMRVFGAIAVSLVYLADGRADVCISRKFHEWDIAAAKLIVEEAGGKMTGLKGNNMIKNDLLCSNGKLHKKVMKLIK